MEKKEKVSIACENSCMNEFATCMQMALDSFAMGACFDAEKTCENQCTIQEQNKRQTLICRLRLCGKPCEKCGRE